MCTGLLRQVCFVENLFQFHNTVFFVVSHNWVSVPYLVNLPFSKTNKIAAIRLIFVTEEWLFIKHVHQILVDVSTEYHFRSKCMEAAMNRYA